MRLKDGRQRCPKCGGHGCYWCRRKGYCAQCPTCTNSEPELIVKDGNEFTCHACGARFDSSGGLVHTQARKV